MVIHMRDIEMDNILKEIASLEENMRKGFRIL